MKIGVIVALSKELDLLLPLLENHDVVEADDYVFHCGTMGRHTIVAMQCGIGKVNAAVGTASMLGHFKPDAVVNTGVAGAADAQVNVMDVVVGERVAYHDVWCGPESEWGAVQGLPLYYEGSRSLLSAIQPDESTKRGLIASGDQFIDTLAKIQEIKSHFPDALAVDMESGAIAQVCHLRHVPFLSVRVISDSPGAGHDNTKQYTDFWEDAPEHTFELLRNILKTLD
ncbi:MAG: 5'-methylthioadenosine/adenosylhomocysteine nucleosidase [Muribaculaceae bacterium]|nr:5'-methylthioadenosine/adenosylhomocysteine nucleosidase [Muribaculaceae bacterium]